MNLCHGAPHTSRKCSVCVDMTYHGECHAVNFMFVFGLVLSERTVPEEREGERETVS